MTRCPIVVAALFVLLGADAATAHAKVIQPAQVELVNSWYVRYLGRGADQVGINNWCQQLACGKPAKHVQNRG